jgi:hypothetical protein
MKWFVNKTIPNALTKYIIWGKRYRPLLKAIVENGAAGSAKAEPYWLGVGALLCAGAYWFLRPFFEAAHWPG